MATALAEAVLRANDNGGYTVPSRATYPHQWNWDSALAALGWAELDAGRAWTELETLVGARDPDGMIPHIAFHTRVPDVLGGRLRGALTMIARPYARYLPGPVWWGRRLSVDGRRISGITQPPLAASCVRLLFEQHPDERRAAGLLRPLLRWHRFLLEERDPTGLGEPVLIHPWESGRDNSVEWDEPLWRVMPEVTVLHRRDTDSVDAAERPSDEHYRRYLTLVRRGSRIGWRQERLARSGAFRVLDPGFSAILARAALDLAWLAEQLGEPGIADESRAASERILRGVEDCLLASYKPAGDSGRESRKLPDVVRSVLLNELNDDRFFLGHKVPPSGYATGASPPIATTPKPNEYVSVSAAEQAGSMETCQ